MSLCRRAFTFFFIQHYILNTLIPEIQLLVSIQPGGTTDPSAQGF
jgi:hypothetical protein